MTHRTRRGIVLLVLAQALAVAACGDRHFVGPGPTAPGEPPPLAPAGVSITGVVTDTAFRPLAGARVEVLDGPQAGFSATADATGSFSLNGTFDDNTLFRATKDGHVALATTLLASCAPCNPRRWLNFNLEVLARPVNITGDYTLTFVADGACAGFPEALRTRTYAATITPSSNRPDTLFELTLTDTAMLEDYRTLHIGVAGDYMAFWLGDAHGQPGLVERVSRSTYLAFEGSAAASMGTDLSTISISLNGFIEYCESRSDMGPRYDCSAGRALANAQCASKNHRAILARR